LVYGDFTIKADISTHRSVNMNFGMGTQTTISYSVWYKGKVIQYPDDLQGNTGYTHLWRVYILEGAPTPTLIAGSQSLFLIKEENEQAVVTMLHTQSSDFAGIQFLDEVNEQPGKPIPVFMDNVTAHVDTLKGGHYLLVNQQLLLHVPDLKMTSLATQKREVGGYYFVSIGGAVALSPDKQNIVFMGGKNIGGSSYIHSMIVYDDYNTENEYVVPYDLTLTRSIDSNYDDREWFKTYFEWVIDKDNHYKLQLRHHDTLPFWQGQYVDENNVYQLLPVKNEMQQLFADFILQQLNLTSEAVHPGSQYSTNMMVIHYKELKFKLWLRPEDKIVVLMANDPWEPEAGEQIKIIHQLGDAFNKELVAGKHQSYFTDF